VLKTTNKKYFKRIDTPDLKRVGATMLESSVAWRYQNQTVIISYDKPQEVLDREQYMLELAHKSVQKMGGNIPTSQPKPAAGPQQPGGMFGSGGSNDIIMGNRAPGGGGNQQ
jgi:hypothetical protein